MSSTVGEIGDEQRDRVWRDRNGDYWKWYDEGERRGWKYQSPHNRWRFGGLHIPDCGPYTFVRWGLLNPFGPPAPWWALERREAYFREHGVPWSPANRALRRAHWRAILSFSECPEDPNF